MTDAEFDRMLEELLAEYGLGLEDIREIKKPLRRTNPKAALPETAPDTAASLFTCRDQNTISVYPFETLLSRRDRSCR